MKTKIVGLSKRASRVVFQQNWEEAYQQRPACVRRWIAQVLKEHRQAIANN